MSTDLRVYVRNSAVERIAEIDDFGSLTFITRDNDVGSWTLDLGIDSLAVPLLDPDTSVGLAGIVVTLDGAVIFSGPVLQRAETSTTARFSGACDNYVLWRHVSVPNPSTDLTLPVTGTASDALASFVDGQIGPGAADANRRVTVLTFTDYSGLGNTLNLTIPRHTALLTALQQIAIEGGGLAFRVQQSQVWSPAYIEYSVTLRQDLRDDITFSVEQGTLEDFEHVRQAPAANQVYGASGEGGDGTTLSPVYVEFDASSILKFGRIERFVDLRQTTDAAEIATTLQGKLDESADRRSVTLKAIPTTQQVLGTHYQLGDIVRAWIGGVQVDAAIREIEVTVNAEREVSIVPMLGTPGMSNDPATSQLFSRINDRVAVLERSAASLAQAAALDTGVMNAGAVGCIMMYAGTIAPSGWLFCQGQSLSTTTYAALFAVCGYTYGGSGGNFNVPSLYGRMPIAAGAIGGGTSRSLGQTGGAETGGQSQTVSHSYAGGATKTGTPDQIENFSTTGSGNDLPADGHQHDLPAVNDHSLTVTVPIMPPFAVVNFIIRYA